MKRRVALILAASVAGVSLGAVPAGLAFADPAGCSKRITHFGIDQFAALEVAAEGPCNARGDRVFNAEIKQDLDFRPDPVVASGADSGTGQFEGPGWVYHASAKRCDHNNYAVYYGRAFFKDNTDYKDSAHNKYQAC